MTHQIILLNLDLNIYLWWLKIDEQNRFSPNSAEIGIKINETFLQDNFCNPFS